MSTVKKSVFAVGFLKDVPFQLLFVNFEMFKRLPKFVTLEERNFYTRKMRLICKWGFLQIKNTPSGVRWVMVGC